MIRVLRLLLPHLIRIQMQVWVLAVALSVLTFALGGKTALGGVALFVCFSLMGFSLIFPSSFFGRNLNWILTLPVSRRTLFWIHYFYSAISQLMGGLGSLLILQCTSYVIEGKPLGILKTLGELKAEAAFGFGVLLVLVNIHQMVMISVLDWDAVKREQVRLFTFYGGFSLTALKERPRFLGGAIALAMLELWLFNSDWPLAGTLVLSLLCVGLWAGSIVASRGLRVSGAQRRVWTWGGLSLGIAQALFLLLYAWHELDSPAIQSRAQAALFLGPLASRTSESEMAGWLEGDLNGEVFSSIAQIYKLRFADSEQTLDFHKLIDSKSSMYELLSALTLFPRSVISLAKWRLVSTQWEKIRGGDPARLIERFLGVPMTREEAVELLGSERSMDARFALSRTSFIRDEGLVPAIMKNFPRFEDRDKVLAVQVLSLIQGRKVTLEDIYRPGLSSRKPSSVAQSDSVECGDITPQSVESLSSSETPRLNLCLRERSRAARFAYAMELQNLGWVELPLTSDSRRTVGWILGLRPRK